MKWTRIEMVSLLRLIISNNSFTPTIDDGSTRDQLFVVTKSLVSYVYGTKNYKQFFNTLEDNIRVWREIIRLIGGYNQSEIINSVHSFIWSLFIDNWKRETHYHHHNFY